VDPTGFAIAEGCVEDRLGSVRDLRSSKTRIVDGISQSMSLQGSSVTYSHSTFDGFAQSWQTHSRVPTPFLKSPLIGSLSMLDGHCCG
jgi:hypothetical protein